MRATAVSCLILGLLCGLGCIGSGPQLAAVSGTVKLDGEPVERGSIQFLPIEGTTGPSNGGEIKEGRYSIAQAKGVVVGKNRVELKAFKKGSRKMQDPTALPGTLIEEEIQVIPPEYNDASTLSRDVQAGSNSFDFDIPTKAKGK